LFLLIGRISGLKRSTETVKKKKKQRVNIYTDSKYACLILHVHPATWKEKGMLTTTGAISHRDKREIMLIVLK
jgi:ribonuclease HI